MKPRNIIKVQLVFVAFFIIFVTVSCSIQRYQDFEKEFWDKYSHIVSLVDYQDTERSINNLNTETAINELKQLGELIENNKQNVPSKRKDEFQVLVRSYEGLKKLQEGYGKWDGLSPKERSELFAELLNIQINMEIE